MYSTVRRLLHDALSTKCIYSNAKEIRIYMSRVDNTAVFKLFLNNIASLQGMHHLSKEQEGN